MFQKNIPHSLNLAFISGIKSIAELSEREYQTNNLKNHEFLNIRKIIQKILPKNKFARNATILSGGTLLGQGLAVIAAPLLTRLYDPADFGVLAIFVSILSILAVIVSLKYQLAVTLPSEDSLAINIVALAIIIVCFITLLSGLCLYFLGDEIVHLLNMPALKSYLWLIPLSLFGVGIYQVLTYWAIRREDFNRIARTKISQGVGMVSTQIIVGLIFKGPLGLLLGDVVGRASGGGTLATLLWKNDRKLLKEITIKRMKEQGSRYKNFPLISSLSGLINSTGLQVAPIMLASFYSAAVVGWFSLTQRIIGIPMRLIGLSLEQIYISETARLAREDSARLKRLYIEQAKKLALLGAVPILILGLSAPLFFSFIFGSSWHEAGRYAQVFSIMFAIQFVVGPLSQTLNILECQSMQLVWDSGRLLTVIISIYICTVFQYSAFTVMIVYSVVMSIAYLVLLFMGYYAIQKMDCSEIKKET